MIWEEDGGRTLAPRDDGAGPDEVGSPPAAVDTHGRRLPTRRTKAPPADDAAPKATLPPERADRLTEPLGRFLKVEAGAGVALLIATGAALVLANSPWADAYLAFWQTPTGVRFGAIDISRSLQGWLNDGLMTLFFFVVALELKRELVVGELRGWRKAALPFAGALGGMVVPAAIYLALMADQPGLHGWGTVVATDTAFVVGCLAVLGSRIPPFLRLFLLSLAIFDDVGAILIVALGYGDALSWPALLGAAIAIGLVFGAARIGIRSMPVYCLIGGALWIAFDASGIHPTVAGVVLGLMTPARSWVSDKRLRALFGRVLAFPSGAHWSGDTEDRASLRKAGRAARETLSPVEQLEITLHPWAAFVIMPLFAAANAGVPISGAGLGEPVVVAIVAGLVIGKPVGVLVFSWLSVRSGIATRPQTLTWPLLFAGAILTGIGFTMSLFIAGLAYAPGILNAAKLGILGGSVLSAVAGLSALGWLSRRRPDSPMTPSAVVDEQHGPAADPAPAARASASPSNPWRGA